MSDIFTDNEDLFTTGSFQEISEKIVRGWWVVQKDKIEKLSEQIGLEIIETLPSEYRNRLLSPEIYDEENPPDDSFLLKTYPPSKSGNDYEIVCSNDVFKATKKITKKEKIEVLDILNGLSQEPTGSMLPRPQNVKTIGGGSAQKYVEKTFNLKRDYKNPLKKHEFYQYNCGIGRNKRCIWTPQKDEKKITILFYGTRNKLNKIW